MAQPTPGGCPAPEWPRMMKPMFPSMDPTDFSILGLPPPEQSLPKPSDKDLDAMYQGEEYQLYYLAGIRAWEYDILNPHVPKATGIAKGHRAIYDSAWEPDESTWFHAFRKSHWNNTNSRVLDAFPELDQYGFGPDDNWSVDNPIIWRELSKMIDLANRILKAATEGEWLQNAVLYPEARRVVDETMPWFQIDEMDDGERALPQEVCDFINREDVHRSMHWTLWAPHEGWERDACPAGITFRAEFGWIQLDVKPFGWLLKVESDSMIATKIRMYMAQTMVHELIHALVRHLGLDLPHESLYEDSEDPGFFYPGFEPFYGDEPIAECGNSLITSIFGPDLWVDTPSDFPSNPAMAPPDTGSAALWPFWYTYRWRGYQIPARKDAPGHPHHFFDANECFPVAGDWHHWLQSQQFWDEELAKYGLAALRTPEVLRSRSLYARLPAANSFCTVAEWSKAALMKLPEELRPRFDSLWSDLCARRLQWSILRRPWHDASWHRWAMSPYSAYMRREQLEYKLPKLLSLPRDREKEAKAFELLQAMIIDESWLVIQPDALNPLGPFNTVIQNTDVRLRHIKTIFYDGIARMAMSLFPPTDWLEEPAQIVDRQVRHSRPACWEDDLHRANALTARQEAMVRTPETLLHIKPEWGISPRFNSGPRSPATMRCVSLMEGYHILQSWYLASDHVAVGLREAVDTLYMSLTSQVLAFTQRLSAPVGDPEAIWLDFQFKLPAYVDLTERGETSKSDFVELANYMFDTFGELKYEVPGAESRFEILAGLPLPKPLEEQAQAGMAGLDTAIPYLTVAQLYDLQREEECRLIVVQSSGWDMEAYRSDTVRQVLQVAEDELPALVEGLPYGLSLTDEASERFRGNLAAQSIRIRPLARVVQWVSLEDVATRDGTKGKPLWIQAGNSVYDITNLDLGPGKEHLVTLLKSSPGGNPMFRLMVEGHKPYQVVEDLAHLRVGLIPPVGLGAATEPSLKMSREELERHEFKETGMFIQIYDDVYDIGTGFAEYHPGGVNILTGNAGRNATELFEKYHPENGKELLESVQALKVGRVVKTYLPGATLDADEIRLRNKIFDVSGLRGTPEYEALHRYRGTNATEDMMKQTKEDAWPAKLWNEHQDLVVGKVGTDYDKLPLMNIWQLAKHNGESVDPYYENASFVAVGKSVIDVTTLMRDGPPVVRDRLGPYIGDKVTHKPLAEWLREHYSLRAVARLSRDKATEKVKWNPLRPSDLKGEEWEEMVKLMNKELDEARKRETPKLIELNEAGKKQLERKERDKEKYPQPERVQGESLKRKRGDDESEKTSVELSAEFEETTRKAIEYFQRTFLQGADEFSWRMMEDAARMLFEAEASSKYWERDGRRELGAKRVRV